MKIYIQLSLFVFLLASCKSEFEKVRTSDNAEKIYAKALEYYDSGDYSKAQSLLELSIPNYRGKEEAEDLFFKYAFTHYYMGEYILSAHYFNSFANTFFNSNKKEEAAFMSAYSNYELSPNPKLDQTYTKKAIEEFQTFINTYPQSDKVEECNALIDNMRGKQEIKFFQQGELYYKLGEYQAAVRSFENMLKDYPGTERAEEVRYLMIKSSYQLAAKSVYSKKEERFNETVKLYNKFIDKFEGSSYKKEITSIYNDSQKELQKFES